MAVESIERMATVKCSDCGGDIWKAVDEVGGTVLWDTRHHFTSVGSCCNKRDKNGC